MSSSSPEREIRPAESISSFHMVFPEDLNSNGIMFGGKVVALMDVCAGMCVGRWARRPCVTASIDAIQFHAAVRQGQMLQVSAQIVHVGNTSCMVLCRVLAHNHTTGDACFTCEGYFTMVCPDENSRPVKLPQIPLETAQQQQDWDAAAQIRQLLLARRSQGRNQAR